MQQYRVNYGLLIGMMVGAVITSGVVYAVWRFQINRNAGALIAEAEKDLKDGKYHDAAMGYTNYLSIRPKDDEVRVKLAEVWADVTEQPDMAPEDFGRAIFYLEDTVRSLPDQKALQRRLVDLYGRVGQVQEALDHLGIMVKKYPDDAELQVMQAQYLARANKFNDSLAACMKLIGYDDKAESFDESKAVAPHDVNIYGLYAGLLRSKEDKPELADQVMEQMIKVNPESATAYLQRGQYFVSFDQADKAQRDFDKAYKLEPENADVLLAMAAQAEKNKHMDQARDFVERANKKFPEDPRFYLALSGLEKKDSKFKEALAYIDKGLAAIPGQKGNVLLAEKADIQFMANDINGVEETVDAMRKAGFNPDYIELMESRVLLAEDKWFEALRALETLRPKLSEASGLADQIDYQMGLCYEHLGQLDKAGEKYDIVWQRNPENEPAAAGKQRIAAYSGRPSEEKSPQNDLDEQISKIMEQPENERDWTKVDAGLAKLADDQKITGANRDLFWAKVKMLRKDYAGARKHLIDGANKDGNNLGIQRTAVTLVRLEPDQGPAKAMQLLDKVQAKFGDQGALRSDRADLLIAMQEKDSNPDELKKQLAKLADPPADWTADDKIALLNSMAGKYLALGMRDEGRACLDRITKLKPDDLPTNTLLFGLALEANDDAGMRTAQDAILKIVGTKTDSTWLYTEARRMLSLYRRGELGKEALADIRALVDQAFQDRPGWFELHLVSAEIELLAGDEEEALKEFDQAEKLGRPNASALLNHVRLLVARGQFDRAKKLVEQMPQSLREGALAQAYSEILLSTGDVDDALKMAEKYVTAAPDDAGRQLAYGQFLARTSGSTKLSKDRQKSLLDQAGKALEKSVELGPSSPDAWVALVTYYILQKADDSVQKAVQGAQLALPEDVLAPVLARCYEIQGQWFNAENLYVTMLRSNPDNLALVQQLATFYLGPGYPRSDRREKATPLINQILHAGADGKLAKDDVSLMWARRVAAQILADTQQYPQLRKAEKLLASNSQNGSLSPEDRLLTAQILAPRPEPVSRIKALKLLEGLSKTQKLNLQSRLVLADLYFATRNWDKWHRQMRETIGLSPDSTLARTTYIRKILQRGDEGDYDEAVRQLKKLQEIAPNDSQTIELMVRVLGKTGKQQAARNYLLGLLPKFNKPEDVDEKQLGNLEFVATLLVDMGDFDNAEKLYRVVVARNPQKVLALADFLGKHRDFKQSMELLEKTYKPETAQSVTQVAITVDRARRDDVGDKYDSQIDGWLDRALLENPDSIALLMLKAEFADVQKKYDEAGDIYRKLLARKDLVGFTRAVVLNNLAFLVSLAGTESETGIDPLKLVQEAAQILGPTPDILDTRAVAYIAKKQYQLAIDDLNYSVTDNPTPSKYFHLTLAYLGAGQNNEALEAWDKGEQFGDIRADLNRMEYERFDEVKAKIEKLRQNAKLTDADPVRAAG